MNSKYLAIIVLIIALGIAGVWFVGRPGNKPAATTQVQTTPIPQTTDSATEEGQNVVVVDLSGKMFEFSKTEIKVKKGDTVKINFQSTEGMHDFVIDEFNAATKRVSPGEVTSTQFVADKTGTFEYYCSVASHRAQGMVGKLIVE